jgi:hypothetical protein
MNSVGGLVESACVCRWYLRENFIAASLASVPEFEKNTRSAKEHSTSRCASFTYKLHSTSVFFSFLGFGFNCIAEDRLGSHWKLTAEFIN